MLRALMMSALIALALMAYSGVAKDVAHAQEASFAAEQSGSGGADISVFGMIKRINWLAIGFDAILFLMMVGSLATSLKLGVTIHSARKNLLKSHLNKFAKSGKWFCR